MRIVVERQPCLLPLPGGERQQVQGLRIDLARAIQTPEAGIELGERQAAFDDLLGNAEMTGNGRLV